jgi:hypothetical protein
MTPRSESTDALTEVGRIPLTEPSEVGGTGVNPALAASVIRSSTQWTLRMKKFLYGCLCLCAVALAAAQIAGSGGGG